MVYIKLGIQKCLHTQDFRYPDNVAYPFGGQDSPEYLVMELHYDNPNMIEGKHAHVYVQQRRNKALKFKQLIYLMCHDCVCLCISVDHHISIALCYDSSVGFQHIRVFVQT